MLHAKILLSLMVLAATAANAQEPSVKFLKEKTVTTVGKIERIEIETDAKSILWKVCDAVTGLEFADAKLLEKKTDGVFVATVSGNFTIKAYAASKTGEQKEFTHTIVVGEGPRGPPKKDDVPTPNKDVTPPKEVVAVGKLQIYIIEETAEAAAARGETFTDPELINLFKKKGHTLKNFDKDYQTSDPKAKQLLGVLLNVAQEVGKLPCLIMVNVETKQIVHKGAFKSNADFLTLVKKYGGE